METCANGRQAYICNLGHDGVDIVVGSQIAEPPSIGTCEVLSDPVDVKEPSVGLRE